MFTELLLVSRLICSDVKMALTVKQQYIFFCDLYCDEIRNIINMETLYTNNNET